MRARSPISSGQGISNPSNIRICLEYLKCGDPDYPVIVDAGVGGVLRNTGIAHAKNPILMADAMRYGIEAGQLAYVAGRIAKKLYATASNPEEGTLQHLLLWVMLAHRRVPVFFVAYLVSVQEVTAHTGFGPGYLLPKSRYPKDFILIEVR